MPRAAAPPEAPAGEYIRTASTGNKISRRCAIYGAANIVLGGKCLIEHRATLRGDLTRASRTQGSQSSVALVTGRYVCVGEGSTLRPPAKTYQGCVCVTYEACFPTFPCGSATMCGSVRTRSSRRRRLAATLLLASDALWYVAPLTRRAAFVLCVMALRSSMAQSWRRIRSCPVTACLVGRLVRIYMLIVARRVGTLPESFAESLEPALRTAYQAIVVPR